MGTTELAVLFSVGVEFRNVVVLQMGYVLLDLNRTLIVCVLIHQSQWDLDAKTMITATLT
jgi:hypothetical protein